MAFCGQCGNEVGESGRFCSTCGAPFHGPIDASARRFEAALGKRPSSHMLPHWVTRGWASAATGAAAAFVIIVGICAVGTFFLGQSSDSAEGRIPVIPAAIALGEMIQRVPIHATLNEFESGDEYFDEYESEDPYDWLPSGAIRPAPIGAQSDSVASLQLRFAPIILLIVLVMPALILGGMIAARPGRDGMAAPLAGAKTGLIFGIICMVASIAATIRGASIAGLSDGGLFTIHASAGGALLFGWLWGVWFAGWGSALRRHGRKAWSRSVDTLESHFRGLGSAVSGAVRALTVGIIALTLLVIAGGVAWAVFGDSSSGFSVESPEAPFIVPEVVAAAFTLSTGSTIGVHANVRGIAQIEAAAGIFGGHGVGSISAGPLHGTFGSDGNLTLPPYAMAGIAIPLLLAFSAGARALRRNQPDDRGKAYLVALQTTVIFAAGFWIAGFLLSSSYKSTGGSYFAFEGIGSIGPSGSATFFLPLVWGLAGTMLAARMYSARHALAPTSKAARSPQAPYVGPMFDILPNRQSEATRGWMCGSCHQPNHADATFCGYCGNARTGWMVTT